MVTLRVARYAFSIASDKTPQNKNVNVKCQTNLECIINFNKYLTTDKN